MHPSHILFADLQSVRVTDFRNYFRISATELNLDTQTQNKHNKEGVFLISKFEKQVQVKNVPSGYNFHTSVDCLMPNALP